MRVIIAGGREIEDYQLLLDAIENADFEITTVISGGARGVDALGERYAIEKNLPLEIFPADWEKYRKAAGPIRNGQMAEAADALIAVWDGKSTGTMNMIDQATEKGLHVYIEFIGDMYQDLELDC